jgi:hypothetical protein
LKGVVLAGMVEEAAFEEHFFEGLIEEAVCEGRLFSQHGRRSSF